MSSFDDAIRQHLDLKRRRGASPHEVAELEREALGLHPHEQMPTNGASQERALEAAGRIDRRSRPDRETIDQETMEIDMRLLIGAGQIEPQFYARDNRQAYDWSLDGVGADISDPSSVFEWEIPAHERLRGAA